MRIKNRLRTEYKRAAAALPFALARAVILVMIVGMTVFCALELAASGKMQPVKVGYAAPEDEMTRLALSYVENMESLDGWCTLVPVSEEEGLAQLEKGGLAALFVLPDNVVESIMDGTNKPAKLYLANDSRIAGYLFEELANAGVGMLRTAQAQIYATYDLVADAGVDIGILPEIYEQLDRHNLQLVMEREQLFKIRRLSATGNAGEAVYYGSALFTIYILLTGLFLGKYCIRTHEEERITCYRLGVPYIVQLTGRLWITAGLLLLLLLPLCLLWLFPVIRQRLAITVTWGGAVVLVLVLVCAALHILCMYSVAGKSRTVTFMTCMSVLVQGYVSGCFWPKALLPQVVRQLSRLIPATYIKSAFTIIFTGKSNKLAETCIGLLCWCVILAVTCLVLMQRQEEGRPGMHNRRSFCVGGSSLFMVLFRRLFHKKSFWLCLGLTTAASFILTGLESESDTVVNAAFYDEEGTYGEMLEAYQGLVRFLACDSLEEVQRQVLTGKAECGYYLHAGIEDSLNQEEVRPVIEVWEPEDGFLTGVANEVLFEQIYTSASYSWYGNYVAEKEAFADIHEISKEAGKAMHKRMEDGSTFCFERQVVQPSHTEEGKGSFSYPVWLVVALQILLCAMTGVVQAVADYREHRFYKGKPVLAAVITVIQPVLMAGIAGILILAVTKGFL